MDIRKIISKQKKSEITETILRQLPDWFGVEKSILHYIETVGDKEFYSAYIDDKAVGFIALDFHNDFTAEIYLIGIKKEYHRNGIGKKLISHAEKAVISRECKLLMVKTLGDSHPDENYAKTREFYKNVGFMPLEEIKEIWGEPNPCLIMVKPLNEGP